MKPCFEMQYLTNTNIYARPVIFMSENQLSDTKRQNINDIKFLYANLLIESLKVTEIPKYIEMKENRHILLDKIIKIS